ncbi:MAG: DUF2958 domain-containing protein [Alphaproteobacteria bacterium]
MKLLTKEIEKRLPLRQENPSEKIGELVAHVKFFTPWAGWTWFACEYNRDERTFFGWVIGLEQEAGYFSLDELEELQGPFGLKVERDLYFEPTKLKDIPEVKLIY